MNRAEREQFIIDQYKAGEDQMILIFGQWCLNNKLDPTSLYREAYPNQEVSPRLIEMFDERIDPEEAGKIDASILLEILQLYGNSDLAFVVSEYSDQLKDE